MPRHVWKPISWDDPATRVLTPATGGEISTPRPDAAAPPAAKAAAPAPAPAPAVAAGSGAPRLSPVRILVALALVAGVVLAGGYGVRTAITDRAAASLSPTWFAPYVDVTATPTYQFQIPADEPARQVVLGFVVAAGRHACSPSWGGVDGLAEAESSLSLDARLALLRQEGVGAIVSFGGQTGTDLAVACPSSRLLAGAYTAVVDRYKVTTIDLDVEGAALSDWSAVIRRAAALRSVQLAVAAQHRRLAVWLTLPATRSGLRPAALAEIEQMLRDHVRLAGVDVMAMDFGPPIADMGAAAEQALRATEAQLAALYPHYGIRLSAPAIWHTMGVTVMIGQNDDAGEQLSVAGAADLAGFARAEHLGRVSTWSLNRDSECGSDFGEVGVLSDDCSGVTQTSMQFDAELATLPGSASAVAGQVTPLAASGTQISLADSPYPVWQPADPYPAGYKVVWLGSVYQAKWYNQGDDPAADVQYSWQTPWVLIGPVLPGEHAPTTTTLPIGTDPAWSPTVAYRAGQRVLFAGLPYEAKWYNEADSPAAEPGDPTGSPWQPLFQVPGEPTGSQG